MYALPVVFATKGMGRWCTLTLSSHAHTCWLPYEPYPAFDRMDRTPDLLISLSPCCTAKQRTPSPARRPTQKPMHVALMRDVAGFASISTLIHRTCSSNSRTTYSPGRGMPSLQKSW